jgi:hypothetical protein
MPRSRKAVQVLCARSANKPRSTYLNRSSPLGRGWLVRKVSIVEKKGNCFLQDAFMRADSAMAGRAMRFDRSSNARHEAFVLRRLLIGLGRKFRRPEAKMVGDEALSRCSGHPTLLLD